MHGDCHVGQGICWSDNRAMTIDAKSPDFTASPARRARPAPYRVSADSAPEIPDVAIITPYYDTGAVFEETVVSVLGQTFQNWEWVIVDDGSSDADCLRRLAALPAQDPRIRVLRQANAGPGAARNKAFDNSRGRYVCLLDSDDMLEPTYLEKCVWFLDGNPEFSFCNSFSVIFGEKNHLWTQGFERGADFLNANSGPPISLIRRQDYADAGGFDATIRQGHEDWDFWLAMARKGHWGETIPEYLQWYRKRGDGRFAQISGDKALHRGFERRIREKYAPLHAGFPNPQRRAAIPYETVPSQWVARNPVDPNPRGRRVMFILPWMAIGGADRVNLDLIEGMVSRGHQVTVCTTLPAANPWECKFSELTPDIFALPNFLRPSDFPRFLAYLIDSRKIDTIVVSASTLGYQLLPFLQARAPQVALLDLCHVEEPHWQNGGHPRFGVGYQDALDLNIVTTAELAKWMSGRGANPDRIRVMYTGVRAPAPSGAAERRRDVRASLGIAPEAPLIIWAGRMCEQKRPDVLAEILREMRDSGLAFEAVLIGNGELRPLLESLLQRYRLQDRVRLLGSVAHERWLEILGASDILLMPSRYEGISVAVLEAMAAGVVPVVSRVGGQAEVIGTAHGFLVEHGPGEIAQYVNALRLLLTSPQERASRGLACRSLMETTYSWGATIDRFEQILSDAERLRDSRERRWTPALGLELATQAIEQKRVADALTGQWRQGHDGGADLTFRVTTVVDAQLVRAALGFGRVRFFRRVLASSKFQGLAHFAYRFLRKGKVS
jgi:glycosyltransferase involved in cell wall biosynthesis